MKLEKEHIIDEETTAGSILDFLISLLSLLVVAVFLLMIFPDGKITNFLGKIPFVGTYPFAGLLVLVFAAAVIDRFRRKVNERGKEKKTR